MFQREEHPFFQKQAHFNHHPFAGDNTFHKDFLKRNKFGMGNEHFERRGGPHFFAGHDARGGGRGGERFFKRGDIKIVLLKILQKQPRHGYDIIKVLEERFKGFYSPSPGSVYPTLQMLEDQDFVEAVKEGRKKVYHITEEGNAYLDQHQKEDPFVSRMNQFENVDIEEMQHLRSEMQQLFHDFFKTGRQVMDNPEKKKQLQELLEKTREELLEIAGDEKTTDDE
ncbi:PadR family transcriptional regulator [Oceanobacillus oncorhynchi]|uniref:Transcriptional regulator YqjI n=1 Tax=Oceanobacillus oncorhynchi TaxID=545501 RepID=A0A0A1MRH9_9BACI|nr:PadR family transcriptional regulator [Oceanobacillus oncorhynchi]CEI81631.1 Transcriptional regulator YqjI [Oceanobacillus oncorhynchi]